MTPRHDAAAEQLPCCQSDIAASLTGVHGLGHFWLGTLGLGGGNTIPPPASYKNFTSDIAAELTATTQRSRLKPRYGGAAFPKKKYKQC